MLPDDEVPAAVWYPTEQGRRAEIAVSDPYVFRLD